MVSFEEMIKKRLYKFQICKFCMNLPHFALSSSIAPRDCPSVSSRAESTFAKSPIRIRNQCLADPENGRWISPRVQPDGLFAGDELSPPRFGHLVQLVNIQGKPRVHWEGCHELAQLHSLELTDRLLVTSGPPPCNVNDNQLCGRPCTKEPSTDRQRQRSKEQVYQVSNPRPPPWQYHNMKKG